ncbi:MAG: CBS domain-containing protein [Deltaproteobacteria bacterium]|nr:CBS domain-containing protein [Deltaproteobacteria bacterium]
MCETLDDVAVAMSRNFLVVDAGARVREVLTLMRESERQRAVVTRYGQLAGLLTESDLIEWIQSPNVRDPWRCSSETLLGLSVAMVMARKPIVVSPTYPLKDAAALMVENHLDALPVVDDSGVPIGILSVGDLAMSLARCLQAA